MSADTGRDGYQLRAVSREGLSWDISCSYSQLLGDECLSPKWGSWVVHPSSSFWLGTANLGIPTLHNACFQIMIGSGWAHDWIRLVRSSIGVFFGTMRKKRGALAPEFARLGQWKHGMDLPSQYLLEKVYLPLKKMKPTPKKSRAKR